MVQKNEKKARAKLKRNTWPINPVTKTIPNKKKIRKLGNRRSLQEDAFSCNQENVWKINSVPIKKKQV